MSMVLELTNVSLSKRLNIDFLRAAKGECIHLLGPNGAGKSSLMAVIAGLISPEQGRVVLQNKELSDWSLTELASLRTMLSQQLESSFALRVGEYLSFYAHHNCTSHLIPPMLETALEVVLFLDKPLTHLSGGERQRVEICRALLQIWPQLEVGEGIAILDEPLQGLDIRHQYAVASLVQALCAKGNTIIMSSHDIALSANYSTSLWLMKKGRIVASGAPLCVATQNNLESVFECHFLISKKKNFLEIQVCAPITLP
jgi:vitamin B12 transport system ATP-binding protein